MTKRAPAKRRGRPTKLTPVVQRALLKALRSGATHRLACQYAGIALSTFQGWLREGDAGQADFLDLSDAVKKAEGQAALAWLDLLDQAATDGDWHAAAWKLERRYPEEYGRKVLKLEGDKDNPVAILQAMTDAQLAALIQQKLREAGVQSPTHHQGPHAPEAL